jgi:hypothetical protein
MLLRSTTQVLFDLYLGTPLFFIAGHDDYFYGVIAIIEPAMIASQQWW